MGHLRREGKAGLSLLDCSCSRPNISAIFRHYDNLYFDSKLGACNVRWSSQRTNLPGNCIINENGVCEIQLSEPLLKSRSSKELKATFLHEMIHAYLFVTARISSHNEHGDLFQFKMNEINASQLEDQERPVDGYGIGTSHSFDENTKETTMPATRIRNVDGGIRPHMRKRKYMEEGEPSSGTFARACETTNGCGNAIVPFNQDLLSSERAADKQKKNTVVQKNAEGKRLCLESFLKRSQDKTETAPKVKTTSSKKEVKNEALIPDVILKSLNYYGFEPLELELEAGKLINRRFLKREEEKSALTLAKELGGKYAEGSISIAQQIDNEGASSSKEIVPMDEASAWHTIGKWGDNGKREQWWEHKEIVAEKTCLRVFERRAKATATAARTAKAPLVPAAMKAPKPPVVPAATNPALVPAVSAVCPVCGKELQLDLNKAEDNAEFNTHLDLCLGSSTLVN